MKKLLFAVCMLFGVAVAASAQQQQDTTSTQNEPSTDYRTQEDPNSEMGQDQPAQDTETDVNQDTEPSQDTDATQQDTDASTTQEPSTTSQDDASRDEDLEVVAVSDLPAIIRQSLEGQEYSGWTVTEAYKKEKDGKVFYKVKMQNGAETKKVKFDEQGNKIKEMDGDDKDHKDHQ